MITMQLKWKEFNVDLEAAKVQIDVLVPGKCLGISANSSVQVHLSDAITLAEQDSIQAYWDGLLATSSVATSYRSMAQILNAIETMKAGIPAKTWAEMSAIERGMLIGTQPTKAQLIAAGLL